MEKKPLITFAGMASWYLNHTAREAEKLGSLAAYWMGNKNTAGIPGSKYKRIWPYHLAQKAFYHLPFPNFEEQMRWKNLPFYDAWVKRQALPPSTNVVQGPMGSCEALFALANKSGGPILKVFDAPNSHPNSLFRIWQSECDKYIPGYQIPMDLATKKKISREIEMADMVLCPSFFVRDSMIANGVPEDKCFVSHFGVDTKIFTKRESPPDNPRFIAVGSLTLRKGQQYLFRAFQEVKRHLPNAELVCVGGIRADFAEEIKKWSGTFEHHEGISHPKLAQLLKTSTAFVLNSLEEGFARVLSEAMAVGLPIIASYESGATTVVRDGIEGTIIRPTDIEAIAEAMIRVSKDRNTNINMGEASFIAGGKSNTWNDYTKRLLNEYSRRMTSTTSTTIPK